MKIAPAIYAGTVTHRRLRPVVHDLAYQVASLFVDVDDLATGRTPLLLSHNRFNLFSIHDADHGEGTSIRDFVRGHVTREGLDGEVTRIFMLAYPRILGFAFNPLTTYYAVDGQDRVRLMLYEVHNTFGGRHTYICRPEGDGIASGTAFGTAEKVFRVSPFNGVEGAYGLRASVPGEALTLGVSLTTGEGPVLKAYFRGERRPLTSAALLGQFFRLPFQTVTVVGGIHWEALKLWLKGLNLRSPS